MSEKSVKQQIMETRDSLLREIERLRNKVQGLEMAMKLLDDEPSVSGGNIQAHEGPLYRVRSRAGAQWGQS